MTLLTFMPDGCVGLDLDLVTIGHIYRPIINNSYKHNEIWLFEDDVAKAQRRVLRINDWRTLSGNQPRTCTRHGIVLTTIYGYDPEKGSWGPSERTSYAELPARWTHDLYLKAHAFITENLHPYNDGQHYYRSKR